MAKRILSIVGDAGLRKARRMLLQAQGFEIISAGDFREVREACETYAFDLVIIGHSLDPKIKRAIAVSIRESNPDTPILEMCLVSPEIKGAEYSTSDSPADLIAAVRRILQVEDETVAES
jgi:DNA-binding response OmpR family regulator